MIWFQMFSKVECLRFAVDPVVIKKSQSKQFPATLAFDFLIIDQA